MSKAKELLLTGDHVTAEEAVELGLVNYAVPAAELEDQTDEVIEKLATGPQTAIRYTKMALNSWLEHGINLAFRQSIALEGISQIHEDHEEGAAAFLEGRRPRFPSARQPDDE
jgi:enoyl-CoA hydratase